MKVWFTPAIDLNSYISETGVIDIQSDWCTGVLQAVLWHSVTTEERKEFLTDYLFLNKQDLQLYLPPSDVTLSAHDILKQYGEDLIQRNLKVTMDLNEPSKVSGSIHDDYAIEPTENWEDEANEPPFLLDPVRLLGKRNVKKEPDTEPDIESWEIAGIDDTHAEATSNQQTRPAFRVQHDFEMVVKNPCKVFITNISYRVNKHELWDFCKKFGRVVFCQVLKNPKGRSSGRAFVTFADVDSVAYALSSTSEERTLREREMFIQQVRQKRYSRDDVKPPSEPTQSEMVTAQEKSSQDSPEDVIVTDDSLSKLTDDCILHIFSFLPLTDIVRSERVCKRWRQLAFTSWKSRKFLHFRGAFSNFMALTDALLKNLLARGCEYLVSLDVSASPRMLTDQALEIIVKYVPNVENLDLSGMNISNLGMKKFSDACNTFNTIKLKDCHGLGEKGIWYLFKNCNNLTNVDLSGNSRINGKCFHVLTPHLQTLVLNNCCKFSDPGIQKLSKCEALKKLYMNNCTLINDTLFAEIVKLEQLEVLHLGGPSSITDAGLLRLGGGFAALRELSLSNNAAVTDTVLQAVAAGCPQLRVLDVSCCYSGVSDAGMLHLQQLDRLQILNISYLHQVSDVGVEAAVSTHGSLTRLVARGCGKITDTSIVSVLGWCEGMELVDVSGCDWITRRTLAAAAAHCTRQPTLTLHLIMGGTMLEEDDSGEWMKPENLDLSLQDFSEYQLRRDRDLVYFAQISDEDEEEVEFDFHDDCEDFLDYDDPLFAERFNMS